MPKVAAPLSTTSFLRNLREQYCESAKLHALVEPHGFSVLADFLANWEAIEEFYATFYSQGFPKTVLCGLNPGRLGAGKTGIPFVDFASLSELMDGIDRRDEERSATFFHSVVSHFEATGFYRSFYVTNVSWVGFVKGRKNANYDVLPPEAQAFIFERFREEIELVGPERIISISKPVHSTIRSLFSKRIDTSLCLPHPNWCAFPQNCKDAKEKYITKLSQFTKC